MDSNECLKMDAAALRVSASPISWWKTNFDDEHINNVCKAMRNECFSLGPVSKQFEEQLSAHLQVSHVTTVMNGSSAILMALIAIGIKPGDEVIIPNRTWIASANAVSLLGAKVVLVDVYEDRPIIDSCLIEEKITSRTKAIIPTSLNGRAIDLKYIMQLAEKYNLVVIEDAAQSLFSRNNGHCMGTKAHIGCFSLSVAKFLPTGQGGFVVTNDNDVDKKLKLIRTQGTESVLNGSFVSPGFNFRYTDILASIGLIQLQRVDETIKKFNRVYEQYRSGLAKLKNIKLLPIDVNAGELPLYIEILCEKRDLLIDYLDSFNIQTRPFYPNINRGNHLNILGEFRNADKFERMGLVLPCGPDQPSKHIEKVLEKLALFDKQLNLK